MSFGQYDNFGLKFYPCRIVQPPFETADFQGNLTHTSKLPLRPYLGAIWSYRVGLPSALLLSNWSSWVGELWGSENFVILLGGLSQTNFQVALDLRREIERTFLKNQSTHSKVKQRFNVGDLWGIEDDSESYLNHSFCPSNRCWKVDFKADLPFLREPIFKPKGPFTVTAPCTSWVMLQVPGLEGIYSVHIH